MKKISLNKLIPHPQNSVIYGDTFDEELLSSIKTWGVITPIAITIDGTIISGHRRYYACKSLGIPEVPVIEVDEPDPDKILLLLISANEQRIKTPEQRAREYSTIKAIESKLAEKRRVESGKRYGENHPKEVVENFPPPLNSGKARDKAAKKVGWSGRTAEKAEKVITKIDEIKEKEPEKAKELQELLNNKSVSKAYDKLKEKKEDTEDVKEILNLKKRRKEFAMQYARMAIYDLRCMNTTDHDFEEALNYVQNWIDKKRKEIKK